MNFVELPSKPGAPVAYELVRNGDDILVVFINGLGLPAAAWKPTVSLLRDPPLPRTPSYLIYDRFGQGATTARDPTDAAPGREPGYGHDLNDAVSDLHDLLGAVFVVPDGQPPATLVFVSASIGVHIARLYAARYPGAVAAHLFLDSNIGNAEFTDLWPDPDAPRFDEAEVTAPDCTLQQYRDAHARVRGMFDSIAKNPEGLDRRNVKDLLPDPSRPRLEALHGKRPLVTVVGHDPVRFAEENAKLIGIPTSITAKYFQP